MVRSAVLLCVAFASALSASGFAFERRVPARNLFAQAEVEPEREPWQDNIQRGGDAAFPIIWLPVTVGVYSALSGRSLDVSQGLEVTLPTIIVWSVLGRGESTLERTSQKRDYSVELGIRRTLPAPWSVGDPGYEARSEGHAAAWFQIDTSVRWASITYDPADFDEPGKLRRVRAWGPVLRAGIEYGARVCVFVSTVGSLLMYRTNGGQEVRQYDIGLEVGIRFFLW